MKVRLMRGDCLELMSKIPDASVDMVLTDIPYGIVNRQSGGLRGLSRGVADVVTFDVLPFVTALLAKCFGSFYVFCSTEQVSELRSAFIKGGLTTRLGIWEKTNPSPMNGDKFWLSSVECCVFARKAKAPFYEHCKSSVWRHATQPGKLHPTQKPVGLFKRLIEASSSVGSTVLDCCMGSGTTGVACIQTKRNFIGIEKDEKYFAIAKDRIKREMISDSI